MAQFPKAKIHTVKKKDLCLSQVQRGDEGTQQRGLRRQSGLKDTGSWFSSLFILSMPTRGSPQSGVLVTGQTVRHVQSGLVGNLCIFYSIFLWNKHHFLLALL